VPKWVKLGAFALLLVFGTVWGALRLQRNPAEGGETARVALIQSNIDQLHWTNASLDTSLAVTESLILENRRREPDLVVLPESGVFTYLERRGEVKRRVEGWSDSVDAPLVVGSLHWESAQDNPYYRYRVYNTAFLVDSGAKAYGRYHKIMLVPVSEAMPFEAKLPILGRLNLGEADFKRGTEHTVFQSGKLRLAPFICYEVIFPGFVRKRVRRGANLLVNITNDGWFGRSSGPYQHAAMARMRSIENGVSLARCANSGISMAADQFGRVLAETGLYRRTVVVEDVPLTPLKTLYVRVGDWPVYLSALAVVAALGLVLSRREWRRRG
jgi:apolipoprotein N-acyltransferase